MFVSWKVFFDKLFFKFSCVYLLLEKSCVYLNSMLYSYMYSYHFFIVLCISFNYKLYFVAFINICMVCFFIYNVMCCIVVLVLCHFVIVIWKVNSWMDIKEKLRLCLFSGKCFPGNHFPNFFVFVCYWKSWSTKNTFQSKENLAWFSGKCFLGNFGRKILCRSCEKFRNVILFIDYIKFGHQTFDCYIYIFFVLNIYFSISSLKI